MLKLAHILSVAGVFAALSTAASAQPAARGMAACRLDLATFCQGVEAGRGKRVGCLTQNKDKLSPECQAAIQQRTAQAPAGAQPPAPGAAPPPTTGPVPPVATGPAQAAPPASAATPSPSPPALKSATPASVGKGARRFAACRADLQVLCAGSQAGGGKMRCLQDNQAKLSPACADTLAQLKGAKQDARLACAADANRLCPGLKGEQRRACFAENSAQLSPDCSAVVGRRANAGGAPKHQ